jgi:hypothetical protein
MTKPISSSKGDNVLVSAFIASAAALVASGTYVMMRSERTRSMLSKKRNSGISVKDINTAPETSSMEDAQYKTDISTGESEETPDIISVEDFSPSENNEHTFFTFLEDTDKNLDNSEKTESADTLFLQTNLRVETNVEDSNPDKEKVISDDKTLSKNEGEEFLISTVEEQPMNIYSDSSENGVSSSSTWVVLNDSTDIYKGSYHIATDNESTVSGLAESGNEDNAAMNVTYERSIKVSDSSTTLDVGSKEKVDELLSQPSSSSSSSSPPPLEQSIKNVISTVNAPSGKDDLIWNKQSKWHLNFSNSQWIQIKL